MKKFTSSGDHIRAQDKQYPGGSQDHAEGSPEGEGARRAHGRSCMDRGEGNLGGTGRHSDGEAPGTPPEGRRDEEAIGIWPGPHSSRDVDFSHGIRRGNRPGVD